WMLFGVRRWRPPRSTLLPYTTLFRSEHEGAYIGLMRSAGDFEYWIGMFFPVGTPAPEGYDFVDLPACTFATCWLYGREDTGELRSEEHTSELQSREKLVCRLLLEKKK